MNVKLPISQDFHSVQGEGYHVGVPMHFVRVTGCNVGRFPNPNMPPKNVRGDLLVLQEQAPTHSICTSYTGEQFLCDTEYNTTIARVAVEQLLDTTWESHICFTGGEPMMYPSLLTDMITVLVDAGKQVNVETSGTLQIPKEISDQAWITCSPKYNFIQSNVHHIDELKFLISMDTKEVEISQMEELAEEVGTLRGGFIYIQPVNLIDDVSKDNIQRCIKLLRRHPDWRLSVQLHKLLGVD